MAFISLERSKTLKFKVTCLHKQVLNQKSIKKSLIMARSDIHKAFPFPLKIMSLMALIAVGFIDHKFRSHNESVKEISNKVFSSSLPAKVEQMLLQAGKTSGPLNKVIIVNSASKKIENSISSE